MKIGAAQLAAVLQSTARYAGLLVFGSDWGLVNERAATAIRSTLGPAASPFRLSSLTREEHTRLPAEIGSLALGGGRKVVHVRDATDALTSVLEKVTIAPEDSLIVIEAGDLQSRSKLRAFAERRADWGAVACNLGSVRDAASEISATLSAAGIRVTPDALLYLSHELVGETGNRRSELQKLTLLAANEQSVDLDLARLCCARSVETSLGAAVSAAFSGDVDLCDALVAELEDEGATGAGLLAILSSQTQRLLKLRLTMDSGVSIEQACGMLSPPLYPRQVADMKRTVPRWTAAALDRVGQAIREADRACKRAASPDFAIAGHLVAAIASRGAKR